MTDHPSQSGEGAVERWLDDVRPTRRAVTAFLGALFGAGPAVAQALQVRQGQLSAIDIGRIDFSKTIPGLDDLVLNLAQTEFQVRRPEDLLILDVKLVNLTASAGQSGPMLRRTDAAKPGVLVVTFQPQAIAEQAIADPGPLAPLPGGPTQSRIAGPTRLAFTMPSTLADAPWGLAGLLEACRTWPMRLSPLAKSAPAEVSAGVVIDGGFAIDLAKAKLDAAAVGLVGGLSGNLQSRVQSALPAASERIGQEIATAARAGQTIDDAFVDTLVARELTAVSGATSRGLSAREAAQIGGALEAAGAVSAIDALAGRPQRDGGRGTIALVPTLDPIVYAPVFEFLLNTPHAPAETVTAIEAPYRLVQSPLPGAAWFHATAPVKRGNRTELWHTRLGRGGQNPRDLAPRPLRAIWSPDYPNPGPNTPPNQPINPEQRREIVRLTAGYDEKRDGGGAYTPRPITARRLILSALGATLDSHGVWNARLAARAAAGQTTAMGASNISAWTHKSALGRDHYVKVVQEGFLYPFGHAAALVEISERKFEAAGAGRLAVLRKRQFLIVREPAKEFPGSRHNYGGREFPFQRIELLTETTPDLANGLNSDGYFLPKLPPQGKPFQFRLVGVDRSGRRAPFSAPLVFLLYSANGDQAKVNGAAALYRQGHNVVPFRDAEVALAPQAVGSDPGDTVFKMSSVTFDTAAPKGGVPAGESRFVPLVAEAKPRLDQVKALLGQDRAPAVVYSQLYLDKGFGGENAAQLFLNLKVPDLAITQSEANPSDSFGGLVSPNIAPSALSRTLGAVAGSDLANTLEKGKLDISDFLPNAKLLGAVDLKDVLFQLVNVALDAAGVEPPKLKTVKFPDKIEAQYQLKHSPLGSVAPIFEALPGSKLSIDAKAVAYLPQPPAMKIPPDPPTPPAKPEASVVAEIAKFQVNLFSCLILTFDKIKFDAKAGGKPKVDVDMHPSLGVLFGGPLEFVNALRDMIPSAGFGDPSPLAITPFGISASYNLALPSVQVGVCSIANMSLGAAFDISFTGGPPRARFNFAERHSTFTITVSMFGGGGFFAMAVDTGGMREVEAALEFGARVEINLGVASGGVYVKGGFYFRLELTTDGQSVEFQGYVELGGHLSILGLITVSLLFHLSLNYALDKAAKTSRLFGQAILSVKVEVLFFSKTVSVKVERQFAGSPADPLFIDFMPTENVWREYCEAFA